MYKVPQDLLNAFRATPDTLRGILRGVTSDHARNARGGDENWSVIEVLCHLRDAEERGIERLRQMRDETNPRIAGYDQDTWARERNYAAAELDDALQAFLAFRATHLNDLEALSPEQWERVGQHDEAGMITIANHTLHLVCHDAIHLAQITRQLQGVS